MLQGKKYRNPQMKNVNEHIQNTPANIDTDGTIWKKKEIPISPSESRKKVDENQPFVVVNQVVAKNKCCELESQTTLKMLPFSNPF